MDTMDTQRSSILRDKVKRLLSTSDASATTPLSENEMQNLVAELQTYQMELEIQNDELRITQHALNESRARYQKLFENAPTGYIVLDSAGMIRDANLRMTEYLALSLPRITNRPFAEFLTEEDEHIFRGRYRSFFSNPKKKMMTLELKPSKSTTRYIRIEASHPLGNSMNSHDEPDLLVAVIDISESKNAQQQLLEREAQLRQAEKMEAIGHLAGGIAHDFNNILAAILGFADLSKDCARDNAEVFEYMDQIISASNRARDLVRQILTFGRPQKGTRQPIYLTNVIRETVTLLRAATPPSIAFETSLNEGKLATNADVTAVHEILMNMGSNAVHAMGDKGTLKISLSDVSPVRSFHGRLGESPHGNYSLLTISDDGDGMSEETLCHIFDPYFTTRKHGTGSGMGLAVVFGLLRQHDGNILVHSTPGIGTTFEIYLPKSERKSSALPAHPLETSVGGTERLLLVDDEEMLTVIGKRMLEGFGYKVDCFNNPEEALAAFKKSPQNYDLLLTDHSMPKLTGLELAQKVTEIHPIPIILCSGYAQAASRADIEKAGICDICTKPLGKEKLIQKVRRVLDKNAASIPKA
ncbi:MAG: response regulator [Deltaproteobacteria bacterium]|nr:response regulator [Deltaproteobacteria bacterium]